MTGLQKAYFVRLSRVECYIREAITKHWIFDRGHTCPPSSPPPAVTALGYILGLFLDWFGCEYVIKYS